MRSLPEIIAANEGPLARRLREAEMAGRRSRHLTSLVRCDHCAVEVDTHDAYHATVTPVLGVERWMTLCKACAGPLYEAVYGYPF